MTRFDKELNDALSGDEPVSDDDVFGDWILTGEQSDPNKERVSGKGSGIYGPTLFRGRFIYVGYDTWPEERQTHYYPGSPAGMDIWSIWLLPQGERRHTGGDLPLAEPINERMKEDLYDTIGEELWELRGGRW